MRKEGNALDSGGTRSEDENDDKLSDQEEETPREIKAVYDPSEHMESCDGWSLFKKAKFNQQPVRRYNSLVAENFTRNRITVCAHLTNLHNTFITS